MTQRLALRPKVRRAVKASVALVSIGAAVATILSSAQSYAPEGSPVLWPGAAAVSWVALAPKADTATALGDTMRFAVTVTDKRGAVVAIPVAWTSDDPNVATVDDQGQVLARALGATTITAAAGSHVARARVVVH
ncbi:MAG: Ig-like domain-containing protein, partial [Gemmatimonadaceae bacterium]